MTRDMAPADINRRTAAGAAACGEFTADDAAPSSGQVIHNPVSGERIVIRETAEQTGGQWLSFDLHLPPHAHVPARHVHGVQREQFTVLTGRMRFQLGRNTLTVGPGETVVVLPGVAHWFGNAGSETAIARVEVRPPLRTRELLLATEALTRAGHIPGTRLPRPRALAALLLEFHRELSIPGVPTRLVHPLLRLLVRFGR